MSIMGSYDLIEEAGGALHEFAADLVPPLKKALDAREPTVVTVAVELMKACLRTDHKVRAWSWRGSEGVWGGGGRRMRESHPQDSSQRLTCQGLNLNSLAFRAAPSLLPAGCRDLDPLPRAVQPGPQPVPLPGVSGEPRVQQPPDLQYPKFNQRVARHAAAERGIRLLGNRAEVRGLCPGREREGGGVA